MASVSPAPGPRPPSTLRIQLNTLTGIRGIASMLVFVVHAGMEPVYRNHQINQTIVGWAAGLGEAAVSFFFMLSGFVLLWAARPDDTRKAFWRRRAVKIYPNVAVTWVAGLILMIIAGEFDGPFNVLPSLALIHVWIPVETVIAGVDGPTWSLACELFFYALFPFLLVAIRRIRPDRLWRWVIGLSAGLLAITVLVGLTLPSEPKALGMNVSTVQAYVLIFFPPVRLIDFALGMLLARIVLEGLMPRIRWSLVGCALLFGWAVGAVLPAPLGWVVPMVAACVLLIGRGSANDLAGRRTLLNSPILVWLGDTSFAFYLIHWLVLHFGRVFLGGGPWGTPVATAFLVGALVLALTLGHLLHTYVEKPAMRAWARPRRRPVAGHAQPEPNSVITPTGARASVE